MSVVRRIAVGQNHRSAEVLNQPTDDILTLSGLTLGATFPGFSTAATVAAALALRIQSGTGSPEGVVTAALGTLYAQTDATGGQALWLKVLGSSTTGWRLIRLADGTLDAQGFGALFAGEDPTSFVTSALTAAGTASRVLGSVRNDPERPGAFQSLLAALDEAQESVALQVLGDSTGNETDEWVYLTAQYLAARYPAYTVKHLLWNDTNQDYDAPTTIQTGPNGARYVQIGSFSNVIPAGEITPPTADYDVRVLAAATVWNSGSTGTLMSRFGAGGSRAFRFQVTAGGFLAWDYSTNGTATVTALSTVSIQSTGIANAAPVWLRATHKMDNGAAGTTVTFYTSPDGITWTILGTAVTLATALTALFVPSSQEWEIGGRGRTAELFVGRIYETDLRDGIAGAQLAPRMADAWPPVNSTTTFGGSPQLTIMNGSKSGADLTYLSDSTRLPKMMPKWGQAAILLSTSHNDAYLYGTTYLASWTTWLTAIRARFPNVGVVALSQNPRTSPATNIREHTIRRRQLMGWAQQNAVGFLDVFRAFRKDGRAITSLIDQSDGIHPNVAAGRLVWAQAIMTALTKRL